MDRYHIGLDGQPRVCNAKIKCRLGKDVIHFSSAEDAQLFIELAAAQFAGGPIPTPQQKIQTTPAKPKKPTASEKKTYKDALHGYDVAIQNIEDHLNQLANVIYENNRITHGFILSFTEDKIEEIKNLNTLLANVRDNFTEELESLEEKRIKLMAQNKEIIAAIEEDERRKKTITFKPVYVRSSC